MALKPSVLAQGILAIADGTSFPASYEEAGKRWAHAYAAYAKSAMSFGIPQPPNSLDAGEKVLAGIFASSFASSFLTQQTAQQMAAGLTAFWLTPPVTFGTGVVTAVGGTSALAQALPGIWASNMASRLPASTCCQLIAAAIHTFTLTVITTTPNPATPPPVLVGPVS